MERKIETRITKLLGIERPILCGAMQWLTKAELVSAVSNAGGLGVMSSASFPDAEALRAEIKKTKELTDKPFAVNLTLMPSLAPPDYPSYIKVCIEEGIKIMETSGRAPEPYMVRLKDVDSMKLNKAADELARAFRYAFKDNVLGPEYPVVSRVKNLYIKQMIIKINKDLYSNKVKDFIKDTIEKFKHNNEYKSVKIQIDVDPI